MNLIEALKAGRPIKRKEWGEYFIPSTERPVFMVQDVLAEDWEVEEKRVTITAEQFTEACNRTAQLLYPLPGYNMIRIWEYLDTLKKELGL